MHMWETNPCIVRTWIRHPDTFANSYPILHPPLLPAISRVKFTYWS